MMLKSTESREETGSLLQLGRCLQLRLRGQPPSLYSVPPAAALPGPDRLRSPRSLQHQGHRQHLHLHHSGEEGKREKRHLVSKQPCTFSLPHPCPLWSHSPQSLQGLSSATAMLLCPPPSRLTTIHLSFLLFTAYGCPSLPPPHSDSCHCRPRSRSVLGRGVRMGSLLAVAAPPWVRVSVLGGWVLGPSAIMSSSVG